MKKFNQFLEKMVLFLALLIGLTTTGFTQEASLTEPIIANGNNHFSVYASFSVNSDKQCIQGNNFAFTNASSTGTYFWDFGDGSTSTEANPSHSFTQAGNFKIHLEVRNGNDYAFTEKFINVMPKPSVDYKTLDGTLNGKSFTFISTSTIQSGSMYYWWDLGNGDNSTLVNPTETYASSGNYHVKLVVTSDFGCKDSITKVITYNTNCVIPDAAFSVNTNTQCKNTNQFAFTNQTSIMVGATLSYTWDFGDGTTSTDKNPTKSFAHTGTYTVTLTAANGNSPGCSNTYTQTVNVVGSNAAFTANPVSEQCLSGNSFTMTNESSSSIKSLFYKWNLGDGTTSTETNPVKVYNTPGTYTITLIANATEASTCPDTITHIITVYPSPVASFSVNQETQCKLSSHFIFNNQSTVSAGSLHYVWDFGDGTTTGDQNPNKVYGSAGTYTVTLQAINNTNGGCISTYSKTVSVQGLKAAFVPNPVSEQCFKNNSFTMTNESSGGGASYLYYQWDLGNGTASTATNPVISYAAVGTYNVKLVARLTSSTCSDTITWPVHVYASPDAGFYSSLISSNNSNSSIHFINTSATSNGGLHYNWFFGDGNSSVDAQPMHVFAKNIASRQVKLVAIGEHSCTDTIIRTVSIGDGLSSGANNIGNNGNNNQVNSNDPGNHNSNNNNAVLSTYPNPFVSNIQVSVNVSNTSFVVVKIFDSFGRLVATKTEQTPSNNQNYGISLSVNNLDHGNYFIQIINDQGSIIGHSNALKI